MQLCSNGHPAFLCFSRASISSLRAVHGTSPANGTDRHVREVLACWCGQPREGTKRQHVELVLNGTQVDTGALAKRLNMSQEDFVAVLLESQGGEQKEERTKRREKPRMSLGEPQPRRAPKPYGSELHVNEPSPKPKQPNQGCHQTNDVLKAFITTQGQVYMLQGLQSLWRHLSKNQRNSMNPLIEQTAGPDVKLKPVSTDSIRASHLLFAALGLGVWEPRTSRESLVGSPEWTKTYNAVYQATSSSMTIKNKLVLGWHGAMLAKEEEGRNKRKRKETN